MPQFPHHWHVPLRGKVFLVLLAAALTSLPTGCSCSRTTPETADRAGEPANRQVVALGAIEPRDGIIDVAGIMGDRIAAIDVVAGQEVKQGDELGHLASESLRRLELESVTAREDEANARQRAEQQVAAARIAQAELAVERAKHVQEQLKVLGRRVGVAATNSELAEKRRAQLTSLSEKSAELVSEQKQDSQILLVETANLELAAAEAEFAQAQRDSEFQRKAAAADLDAAVAAGTVAEIPTLSLPVEKKLAAERLAQTMLLAPSDGTVLQVFARVGETVGQTPLLQLANLQQMVVVAEVYETDVKRLSVGQKATIKSDAFRTPYDEQGLRGTVEQIGRVISSPARKSLDPFAQADRRVIEARILLDAADALQAAEFVGLQVEVTFADAKKSE